MIKKTIINIGKLKLTLPLGMLILLGGLVWGSSARITTVEANVSINATDIQEIKVNEKEDSKAIQETREIVAEMRGILNLIVEQTK